MLLPDSKKCKSNWFFNQPTQKELTLHKHQLLLCSRRIDKQLIIFLMALPWSQMLIQPWLWTNLLNT